MSREEIVDVLGEPLSGAWMNIENLHYQIGSVGATELGVILTSMRNDDLIEYRCDKNSLSWGQVRLVNQ